MKSPPPILREPLQLALRGDSRPERRGVHLPPPSSTSTSNCACSRFPTKSSSSTTAARTPPGACSKRFTRRIPECRPVQNPGEHGFGRAITYGFSHVAGDAVVVMMADESDDCRDVVRYWQILGQGWDAVFGSRFVRGGGVIDYPRHKLLLNRMANLFLRLLFGVPLNDFTNAFKAYRRTVIDGCRPFLSPHFNLTVELPLKTIVRGYSWTVMPITWRNRRAGESKLKIKEMGSRYLFIALYCWLEKYFSRGDYRAK